MGGLWIEIVDACGEPDIGQREQGKKAASHEISVVPGQHQYPTDNKRNENCRKKSWKNTPSPSRVKVTKPETARFRFTEDQPTNQVSRDHEENVNPRETDADGQ
eukprot:CAMPEP_0184445966 /NCGR_PEP_ID=MMETSP0740-20130409/2579_1 /TAXON_ID=385413 /ORGANISM="Thalassiosira miniscula, Strain CCMP1093" /LENGTH=103 /DNA_ID=CAMNT_0026815179 /DNA_START=542 /DNA_END=853 /DNA_ORIENTATION=-